MKPAAITLGILLAVALVGVIAWRFLRTAREEIGGFRDWVKNPQRKQAAAEYLAAREALEVPDDVSDAEIREAFHTVLHRIARIE